MNYIYSILGCVFVGINLFSLKLVSKYENYFYEILLFMITTLLISRVFIYYAMKETDNPTNVHIIISFSVFVTLILSNLFLKLNSYDIYTYILGIIFVLLGLNLIRIAVK